MATELETAQETFITKQKEINNLVDEINSINATMKEKFTQYEE